MAVPIKYIKIKMGEIQWKLAPYAVLSILVLVVGFLFLTDEPSITGYISYDSLVIEKQVDTAQSKSLLLVTKDSSDLFFVSSVRVTGKVVGNGTAKLYLKAADRKLLVFTSEESKDSGMGMITGLGFTAGQPMPEEELAADPLDQSATIEKIQQYQNDMKGATESVESIRQKNTTLDFLDPPETRMERLLKKSVLDDPNLAQREFNNFCEETCRIEPPIVSNYYELEVIIDPGTVLRIEKILIAK